jgi:hypothetical protein
MRVCNGRREMLVDPGLTIYVWGKHLIVALLSRNRTYAPSRCRMGHPPMHTARTMHIDE